MLPSYHISTFSPQKPETLIQAVCGFP